MQRRRSITSIFQAAKDALASPTTFTQNHIPQSINQYALISGSTAKVIQISDHKVVHEKEVTKPVQDQFEIISKLFPKKISPRDLFPHKNAILEKNENENSLTPSNLQPIDMTKILPKEITHSIFMFLDPASYSSAVSVSKSWKEFDSPEVTMSIV